MRIRSPRDFWAGLLFVGIAALFIGLASQYRFGETHRMGPGYFPIMVGALLAILGAVVTGRALVFDGPPLARFNPRPLLVTLLAVVLFALAIERLGLAAAIAVLVMVSAYADRDVRLLPSLVLAVLLIAFSVATFVWLLGLPLQVWPQDIWPQW
jgi:Tripartite tricarboxylate transporter TctB family